MPYAENGSVKLHYQVEGRDDAPWLILSNSLGTGLDMWAPQMPALLKNFHVLRYDTRGHGQSAVPVGPYTIEQLAEDVVAIMDTLHIERAHFCGLSMGGMTGLWLGIHRPERLVRLALCNTAAKIGTDETWNERIARVGKEGLPAIVPSVLERWFTASYRERAPEDVKRVRDMLLATTAAGYVANCAAVRDMDQRQEVDSIRTPTLVIAGTHDQSTPAQEGKWIADNIAAARYVELDAAHLSNWEQTDKFNSALVEFLAEN